MTANLIWGKASKYEDELSWLPLWIHLKDTHYASQQVWRITPYSIKEQLQEWLNLNPHELKHLYFFLSAAHDCGKATPDFSGRDIVRYNTQKLYTRMNLDGGFRYETSYGSNFSKRPEAKAVRHEIFSALILEKYLKQITGIEDLTFPPSRQQRKTIDQLSVILAGHHGRPTRKNQHYKETMPTMPEEWVYAQEELVRYIIMLEPDVGDVLSKTISNGIPIQAQALLTALVIEADWLASTEEFFPLIPFDHIPKLGDHDVFQDRWNVAKNDILTVSRIPKLNFNKDLIFKNQQAAEDIFYQRFGFKPNELQKEIINISLSSDSPDIFIVEAEMGGGKTEAAIIAAEILAERHNKEGFMFALPTMSTSDAIYSRVHKYLKNFITQTGSSISLSLTHSKSYYSKARTEAETLQPEGWFQGKYKKYLNSHAVGTIDSVLMLALKSKSIYWKHLGFASKVVIIDEVHSADPYMQTYLLGALRWLSAYKCPVIILSATLPENTKQALLNAYQGGVNE